MDLHKFRLVARNMARVAVAKTTERDLQAARKAIQGYTSLIRELDGLLDCILNGPNDHLISEVNTILDGIQMLVQTKQRKAQCGALSSEMENILQEEYEAEFKRKFGSKR